MATLVEKGEALRQQLGIAPGTPLHEIVSKAENDLGLTAGKRNLGERIDQCCNTLGVSGGELRSDIGAAETEVVVMGQVILGQPVSPVVPMQPVVDGTYDGPERLRYVVAATADAGVVSARVFQGDRDTNIVFEMRRSAGTPAVWDGVLPRRVYGGAQIRWEFEPGFGAFTSSARGKPARRFVKQPITAPVQPMMPAVATPVQTMAAPQPAHMQGFAEPPNNAAPFHPEGAPPSQLTFPLLGSRRAHTPPHHPFTSSQATTTSGATTSRPTRGARASTRLA